MNILKKVSTCILTGTMILSGMTSVVFADETRINTDHNTYYIGNIEYNEDGTQVDPSHVCNMHVDTPSTDDPNKEPTPTPEEPSEPVTPNPDDSKKDEPSETPDIPKDDNSNTSSTPSTDDKKQETSTGDITIIPDESQKNNDNSQTTTPSDAWYHPADTGSNGYIGEVHSALKYENYITGDWTPFMVAGNPFGQKQCTYFAWSRFYQVYGYDSGARGNGKTNAYEVFRTHRDKFDLSNTPSGGAVFSAEANTLYPEYGHVGFIEAFDGNNLWIAEGNVKINGSSGNIWIHRMTWSAFKAMYPDVVFAVPKASVLESSIVSTLYLNSSNTSINTKENKTANKLEYKNTKRKNTIYSEDGKKLKQYKFKAKAKETKV